MSDLPEGRRKKIPFTKRRKHPIIKNPASFDSLPDDVLLKMMCNMKLKTLIMLSSVNKRVNGIFRSPWFFRQCLAPKLSPKQRMAALVSGYEIEFKHVTEDEFSKDLDFYNMIAKGVTIDGVRYHVEWFLDTHAYADTMNENFDPEDAEEYGNPPEDEAKRLLWFRAHFDSEMDNARGTAVFQFPPEMNGVEFVREHVRDVLTYFTRKFSKYLDTADAILSGGGRDEWYIEVEIRPFDVSIAEAAYDGDSVIEEVEKAMKKKYKTKEKEKTRPRKKEKEPSTLISKNIEYSARQLQLDLIQAETNPRQSDDPRLQKMCDATIEEARELLEKIRIGEANDEATIDRLNRVNARLLECIE